MPEMRRRRHANYERLKAEIEETLDLLVQRRAIVVAENEKKNVGTLASVRTR
jgi:hypothetical protein